MIMLGGVQSEISYPHVKHRAWEVESVRVFGYYFILAAYINLSSSLLILHTVSRDEAQAGHMHF